MLGLTGVELNFNSLITF